MKRFIKSFFIHFVFLGFFISNAFAEIVNKVQIEGNERVSKETIVIFGDIKIGSNYESSDINLLIKKLYETKFFANVSVVRLSVSSILFCIFLLIKCCFFSISCF